MPKTIVVEDTAPEAETEQTPEGATSLSEILGGRHERQAAHEPHREVGAAPPEDDDDEDDAPPAAAAAPAAAKPGAQPAPTAERPATGGAEDPASDPKAPKWYRDHMRKVNRELEEFRSGQRAPAAAPAARPAAPAQEPRKLPNPAEDPDGYHQAVTGGFRAEMQQFRLETTLNFSERFARQSHGNEAFEETKAWLTTRPDLEDFFLTQPDPWGAAFSYFTREKLADEIGDDPAAWREKERQRIRDEILAEQSGGQAREPAAQPQMRHAPPAAAATARSAAPRDPSGRFAGPQPLKTRNRFD
jgi:hypothetical protein